MGLHRHRERSLQWGYGPTHRWISIGGAKQCYGAVVVTVSCTSYKSSPFEKKNIEQWSILVSDLFFGVFKNKKHETCAKKHLPKAAPKNRAAEHRACRMGMFVQGEHRAG